MDSTQRAPKPFRVLLVESDPEKSGAIMSLLGKVGLLCYHAPDPQAGMEAFQQHKPHLVLLGLGLPDIGAAAMCPQLRAVSKVPIIIVSVRTRKEDHLHALHVGADDFVPMRPPDAELLRARVLNMLRRVYHYDGVSTTDEVDTSAVRETRAEMPPGWVKCEACDYMGPWTRFERVDMTGKRIMICPHCNEQQSLRHSL